MTTPIDPGNTAALFTVLDNAIVWAIDNDMTPKAATRYGAVAVALAVCPSGFSVISDDDLRAALSIIERHNNEGPSPLTDRLRDAIQKR